jgi:uncharacterized protein
VADRVFFVGLTGLKEGRHRYELTEAGSTLDLPADDLTVEGEVHLDLVLDRTGSLLIARGEVVAEASMTCSRCLEPYVKTMSPEFEAVIRMGNNTLQLEDEEDTPVDFVDDGVSFAASVRESLILAVPMKPLCDDECRGLCQRCGTNLNRASCECPTEPVDPRWNDLKILSEEN